MKSLTQFLEAQNFLIKGHTKKQDMGYVDLDLPSGIKWATCNIGANKPEEYGLLFQFGRIDGYKCGDKNHKFLSKKDYTTTSGTKYKEGDTLKQEDDAAYQATKGKFRMPTKKEIDELLKHTNNESAELNGVEGQKFISKKDESKWIFIPNAGCFSFIKFDNSFDDVGHFGYIWSASVDFDDVDYAHGFEFSYDWCSDNGYYTYFAYSVRGVCK